MRRRMAVSNCLFQFTLASPLLLPNLFFSLTSPAPSSPPLAFIPLDSNRPPTTSWLSSQSSGCGPSSHADHRIRPLTTCPCA